MLRGADKRLFLSGQLKDVFAGDFEKTPGHKKQYTTAGVYDALVLASSPTAYWKLEDASGHPQDSGTGALHITSEANLSYGVDGPFVGWKGIRFVSNAFASRSAISQNTGDRTLEFWIKLDAVTANFRIFRNYRDSTSRGWEAQIKSTGKTAAGSYGVALGADSVSALGATWTHVVLTVRSGTWRHYFNGVIDQPSGGSNVGSTPMVTTAFAEVGTSADLTLSRVAYYDTSLSDAVILSHYQTAAGII